MIIDYLEGDYKTLITTLFVVCFAWIVVIVAMLIDLYFGVKKAKELGEATSSEGFRRTINKATYYFAFLFDIFDVVTPYFFPHPLGSVPFVSIFVALVFTEAKSVREKAENKARRRTDDSFRKMLELMQNREDVMKEIADHLKKERQKQEN